MQIFKHKSQFVVVNCKCKHENNCDAIVVWNVNTGWLVTIKWLVGICV